MDIFVKIPLFSLVILAFAAAAGYGQVPTVTPTPVDDDVVKITTALVQIDVTVTDQNNRPIRDLKPGDFEIYQNGKKQEISNFSFVSNQRTVETPANSRTAGDATPKGVTAMPPPSPLRPANVRRTIALVIDDLNLSMTSTVRVQQALRHFVDNDMQPGDLVAIVRTGAGIGALQQFTNDKRQLYAAIDRVKFSLVGTGNVGAFAPLQGKSEIENMPQFADMEANNQMVDNAKSDYMEVGTIGAVNFVLRGMSELPGRKSIVLVSDGFALPRPNGDPDSMRVFEALKKLVDRANRASVVVDTLDARGLVVTGLTAADNAQGRTGRQLLQVESSRAQQIAATQEGLLYLAKETGGRSIINNNDIAGGVRQMVDDQSYYLIGYVPDEDTFKPGTSKYNNLSVKVNRPGLLVRFRSGFFATPDRPADLFAGATPGKKLEYALTSPFAINDITLNLNALYQGGSKDGSTVRALLHVKGSDLSAVDVEGGKKKVSFDLLALTFGDNGSPVDKLSKTFNVTLTAAEYQQLAKTGFVYDFLFPVKKPGAYQLRMALQDKNSQKIGSANQFIQVPDLGKHRLTLSGIAVQAVPLKNYLNKQPVNADESSALADTAQRRFKLGRVLHYGFAIYNASLSPAPQLSARARLFKDGKLVFAGRESRVQPTGPDPHIIPFDAGLTLGTELEPGDYVLEITVTDKNRKDNGAQVSEYVQFELVG
jgi:VWFA-related protein